MYSPYFSARNGILQWFGGEFERGVSFKGTNSPDKRDRAQAMGDYGEYADYYLEQLMATCGDLNVAIKKNNAQTKRSRMERLYPLTNLSVANHLHLAWLHILGLFHTKAFTDN